VSPASGVATDFSTSSINYTVISEDGLDTTIWKVSITKPTLEVKYLDNDAIQIYPNPVIKNFSVRSGVAGIKLVEIFDMLGNKILSKSYHGDKVINLELTHKGLFLIKVFSGNREMTKLIRVN
jgi:hypothetical protein